MPNSGDSWIIKPVESSNYPAILEVSGLLKINDSTEIEIKGANFDPNSYPVIDWLTSSGGAIVSFTIDNPNLCKINIVAPSQVGNYPIEIISSNGLSSAAWGGTNTVKVVDFNVGWIDLTSNGPDLGIIESSLNVGLTTRNLSNSGLVRDANGITKDAISDQVFAVFKNFPILEGAKISVIFSNYTDSKLIFGDYYGSESHLTESHFSLEAITSWGSTRLFGYANDGSALGYSISYPSLSNKQIVIGKDYLLTMILDGINIFCSSYEILDYGATHDLNLIQKVADFVIAKNSSQRKSIDSFLGLGFRTSSSSVLTSFKAFKIN